MGEHVTMEHCEATSSQILKKLDSIEQRLFRDNGSVSMQTRLDRHEFVIRALLWAISVTVGALLAGGAVGLVIQLKNVLGGA
jgi:hypothetical protein